MLFASAVTSDSATFDHFVFYLWELKQKYINKYAFKMIKYTENILLLLQWYFIITIIRYLMYSKAVNTVLLRKSICMQSLVPVYLEL